MPFAPVEGGKIHCRLDGQQGSPVLVLSNALGTDLSMWDAQFPEFARHFQVLRYDSYGHGASSFEMGGFQIDRLGRDVVQLLDHLEIKTAAFCGLSVGGLVGQWLGLNAPDRITKLVLCNTAAQIGNLEGWNARIDTVNKGGLAAISDGVLERWFTPAFHQREPETVHRFRKVLESTRPESYVATSAAIRDADFQNQVSKIRTETLVIAGTHDKSTPPEAGRYLVHQIPNSKYVELNAAHLSNVELRQPFLEKILRFVNNEQL